MLSTLYVSVAAFAFPAPASAYTVATGWAVSDFATAFPTSNPMTGVGPTGPVTGPTGKLYVSDDTDGNVYVFGSSGGVASPSSRLTSTPLAGPVDLAFTPQTAAKIGRLIAAH